MSVLPLVQNMLANPGVYIGGDTEHPSATIVYVSQGGKVYSTKIDEELDPARFLATATFAGPYVAGR